MFLQHFFSQKFLLATLLFLLPLISTAGKSSDDFIRRSCDATKSPNICYNTLSRDAKTIRDDPVQLAQVSVKVSLLKARQMESYINKKLHQVNNTEGADPRVVQALSTCARLYKDAVTQLDGPSKWLQNPGKGEDLKLRLDDMDMNIALAGSYEWQCVDAWKYVADGPVKAGVSRHRHDMQVGELTDIAKILLKNAA